MNVHAVGVKAGLSKWNYSGVYFFRNFPFQQIFKFGCRNEFEDNNDQICNWFAKRDFNKIDSKHFGLMSQIRQRES